MARYLDPTVDLTFKRVFGEHPDLLISFLNSLLPLEPGRMIETIEYLPAGLPPDAKAGKNTTVEVLCKDNFQRKFIVEMQIWWSIEFRKRFLYDACEAYIRQSGKANIYMKPYPLYSLSILYASFDNKTDDFYHHYQIANIDSENENTLSGIELVFVELNKFKPEKMPTVIEQRKVRDLAILWLRFLSELGEDMNKLPEDMQKNEYIAKAAQLCEVGEYTPEELLQYENIKEILEFHEDLRN